MYQHSSADAYDSLPNRDLAPVQPELRTWTSWHIASLWFGAALHATLAIIFYFNASAGMSLAGLDITFTALIMFSRVLGDKFVFHLERHGADQFAGGPQRIQQPPARRAIYRQTWFGGFGLALAPYLLFRKVSSPTIPI